MGLGWMRGYLGQKVEGMWEDRVEDEGGGDDIRWVRWMLGMGHEGC